MTTITTTDAELKSAFSYLGWAGAAGRAERVIDAILHCRRASQAEAQASWAKPPVESITQAELAEALTRLCYAGEIHADRIFESVKAHREPIWRPGDVVRDAKGTVWQHTARWPRPWERPGSAFSYDDGTPARPLTRLTEET